MTHARVRPGPAHSGIRSESRYHVPPRPPNPCPGGAVFPKADSTNETTAPRYRPGSGTSPAPGTADPGDHSTPAAAPLRIYPARSAGPGFRVSPSVRIPGNCACVRPPHRMPPPTRTANRIIGRTRLSGCCPSRQPPVHTTSRPVRIRFPWLSPLPVAAPHIRRPARSLSPPATVPATCWPCLPHIRRPVRIRPRSAPFSLFPSLRSLFIPPLFPAFSSARFPFRKYFPLEICFIGK